MNIGIWVPMTFEERSPPRGQYDEFFRAVEGLGFHSVWVTDSVLNRTHLFDDLTLLTWAAAVTTRLRVGTSVMLLNLRHPVRVARAAASLDVLSGGRLTLGVSLGGHPPWYEALGVDMRTRVSRFVESVALLRRMWSGQGRSFQGRYSQVDDAGFLPRPVQPGGIPLLFGGHVEAVLKRAGELADGFIEGTRVGPQEFAERWARVREFARDAGRDDRKLESGKMFHVSVDDDPARARSRLEAHMRSMYGDAEDIDKRGVMGPPDECAARVLAFKEAGVDTIMVGVPSLSIAHLERIAHEVVPLLD